MELTDKDLEYLNFLIQRNTEQVGLQEEKDYRVKLTLTMRENFKELSYEAVYLLHLLVRKDVDKDIYTEAEWKYRWNLKDSLIAEAATRPMEEKEK